MPAANPGRDVVSVNGREYELPARPAAVITVDGGDPAYFDHAFENDLMPRLVSAIDAGGIYTTGLGYMPSFTNPNNMSIVTGVAPGVHGITGNHFLDESGEEVQLNRPEHLRAGTIHSVMRSRGKKALCVTAKVKLRMMLGTGGVASISAEKASGAAIPEYEIDDVSGLLERPVPGVYDPDLSMFALDLALAVNREAGPLDLVYISLTDFVQHTNPPGTEMSDTFHSGLDERIGGLLDAGFSVGITADHGMNSKHDAGGLPRVRYLSDILEQAGIESARVVLPITDPYVRHHGSLGSFAWVHIDEEAEIEPAAAVLRGIAGVEEVYGVDEATAIYEHAPDRIGTLSVGADRHTTLGKSAADHDLGELVTGLRSHGGRFEQVVPLITTARPRQGKAAALAARSLRNSDIHDLVLNCVE